MENTETFNLVWDDILAFFRRKKKPKPPVPPVVPKPPVPGPTHMPKHVQVAIFNKSTVASDTEVLSWIPTLQVQVSEHFAPSWGVDADLTFVPVSQQPPSGYWQLGIFDTSDQAGALGYHDITSEGLPLGKVFAATDKQYGANPSITTSHELLEMLGDPEINLVAFDDARMRLWAYEACDAVEADRLGYQINGIWVSDFVTPYWFMPNLAGHSVPFSFRQNVHAPFELAKGGYISFFDIRSGSGWQQIYGDKENMSLYQRPHVGSRRERRRTPRDQWLASIVT